MERFLKTATLAPVLTLLLGGGPARAFPPAKFHIGISTTTVYQGEDEIRAVEALQKEYGDVKDGGMIRHVIAPDDFMSQQETLISNMVSLAEDPLVKVVVTVSMLPGTAEAFKRIRAKRPDILLLGGIPNEDPLVISKVCDMCVDLDFVSRGYTIPWVAKQLGAKTMVHVSFPRHMAMESFGRRRAIMEEACKDLGLKFVYQSTPDPLSEVGVAGTQQFLLEKMPQWIAQYAGPNHDKVAFFTSNDAQAYPIIKRVVENPDAIFVEPGSASPILGFPDALGLNLKNEAGNWQAIMAKIESDLKARGAVGRLGTWPYSSGYVFLAGMAELGKRVVEGKAKLSNPKDVFDALGKYSPGSTWFGNYYTDLSTGTRVKTEMLVYMDTYVFGRGNMGTTKLKIPEKYATIRK
ncbi:MAG: DUF3798 domain-containing protein [Holophaga sp.]|jgi:hypothetical protein